MTTRLSLFITLAGCITLVGVGVGACKSKTRAPEHDPAEVVPLVFEAIAAADCPTIQALTAGGFGDKLAEKIAENGCEEGVKNEQQIKLVKVIEAKPDGRSPDSAYVVRILIRFPGQKPSEQLARVEKVDGEWKVTHL